MSVKTYTTLGQQLASIGCLSSSLVSQGLCIWHSQGDWQLILIAFAWFLLRQTQLYASSDLD